jgi:hypothetical protein
VACAAALVIGVPVGAGAVVLRLTDSYFAFEPKTQYWEVHWDERFEGEVCLSDGSAVQRVARSWQVGPFYVGQIRETDIVEAVPVRTTEAPKAGREQ